MRAIAEEIAALPSPDAVAQRIEELTGDRDGRRRTPS